jgi:hypothetical protein
LSGHPRIHTLFFDPNRGFNSRRPIAVTDELAIAYLKLGDLQKRKFLFDGPLFRNTTSLKPSRKN